MDGEKRSGQVKCFYVRAGSDFLKRHVALAAKGIKGADARVWLSSARESRVFAAHG